MELLRLLIVVVILPLLLLVVEFASCDTGCPESVDDEVHAAAKQEAGPSFISFLSRGHPHHGLAIAGWVGCCREAAWFLERGKLCWLI